MSSAGGEEMAVKQKNDEEKQRFLPREGADDETPGKTLG